MLSTDVPNWTVPYDMPSTVLDSSSMSILWDSMSISLRSMGSTGVIILGVVCSVSMIAFIVKLVFMKNVKLKKAVEQRVFNRSVDEEDTYKNFDGILENKLMKNGINRFVHNRDIENNFDAIVNSKVLDRKIIRAVNKADAEKNMDEIVDDKVLSRSINGMANKKYYQDRGKKR